MYERMSDDMGGLPSYHSVHYYMIHLPLSLDTKAHHHHPPKRSRVHFNKYTT